MIYMDIPKFVATEEDLLEIQELIEDSVEHLCDARTLSGEFVWGVIECLAEAKLAQLNGDVI